MYQIDNPTAAATQPTSTTPGTPGFFTDGNAGTGVSPTIVPAEYLNTLMLELINVVTGAGLTLSKSTFNQVYQAVRRLSQKSVVLADTGAVNAYTAGNSPVLVTGDLVSGLVQRVSIAALNTGASTYAPDGLASKPIYGMALVALQGGELPAKGIATLMYLVASSVNSGNGAWILIECTGGAQQITNATASQHAVPMGQIQTQAGTAFTTAGTAPAFTLNPSPAITAYAANQRFRVSFGAAGTTGGNTLNISNLGAKSLMQYDSTGTLVPAVITAGLLSDVEYNGTYCIVLDPVAQKTSVVGSARNLKASLSAVGTSVSFTADEIVAETALGGAAYQLANFSKTFSGSATGAGGMDTGSLPASGYVAIYAIYNPTTNTGALLGMNATSAVAGNVYSGSNMPSGYTASALLAVWPTNSSSQLIIGTQTDRQFDCPSITALSSTTVYSSYTAITLPVPKNARAASGNLSISGGTTPTFTLAIAADINGTGARTYSTGSTVTTGIPFSSLAINTAQTAYVLSSAGAGSPTNIINITGYTI